MSRSANVLSSSDAQGLQGRDGQFRAKMHATRSADGYGAGRMRDWLERDQLGYWQAQIKKREEDLMQVRADLHKRKSRSKEATPSRTPTKREFT